MRAPTLALLILLPLASLAQDASFYSPGGWPTLHQGPDNRRAVDVEVLEKRYRVWHALAGASVLTAPVTSPDGRQLYVTTGLAAGASNLHSFSIDGELLWQAAPWRSADEGVDACAILSSPIVDTDGDVYINDCNQLFAFRPDGSIKWILPLPAPREDDWAAAGDHPVNAFTTAAFSADGHIVGVTNFGDVLVVDRDSGNVLNEPYRLPAVLSPYSDLVTMPESLLGQDLMDPNFREWTWQLIFGGMMRSANTPAIAANDRVFIVGSSARAGIGALWGLDLVTAGDGLRVREAFSTEIGIGSGSSPALSPAQDQAYVCDEEGWFYAIDTASGEVRWKVQTDATAGAAAVGADGIIYALQDTRRPVVAIDPSGEVLWQSDISALSRALPSSWLLGDPVGQANGNPVVTNDAVLVPVIFGYELPLLGATVPVTSHVVALDLRTGAGLSLLAPLPDDSSGITAVLPDGTLINSLGATLTSAVAPLKPLVDWLLPGDLEMLAARGGIQVALPLQE